MSSALFTADRSLFKPSKFAYAVFRFTWFDSLLCAGAGSALLEPGTCEDAAWGAELGEEELGEDDVLGAVDDRPGAEAGEAV
jgi:hypothetical protein